MDLNLQFWRNEGKTFTQRFLYWIDVLDPKLLTAAEEDIDNSRKLLLNGGKNITKSLQDEKVKEDWKLSLASVNPSTGDTIPLILRPPAFLALAVPLSFAASSPRRSMMPAFLWQFLFHTYIGRFNFANGNSAERLMRISTEEVKEKQTFLNIGSITLSALTGALPFYYLKHYESRNPTIHLFSKIIAGPLTAVFCALNVLAVRNLESENGIEVMDGTGKVIGVSRVAGEKAIKETALSRGALFGMTIIIPDIAMHFLKRRTTVLQNSVALVSLRLTLMIFVFGAMLPASFSWFPQLQEIKLQELEPELISSTKEAELFYYRGV